MDTILLLCGGKGTRMKDLTKDKPKHLIKVLGKPFLYYLLKNVKISGFKEVIIVIGYKGEMIKKFIKTLNWSLKFKFVDQRKIKNKYGTAIPVLASEGILKNKNFIVAYGDNLFDTIDFKNFKKLKDNFIYTSGMESKNPKLYGLAFYDENCFVYDFVEKPKDLRKFRGKTYLVNAGLYKFTPKIFKYLKKIKKSKRGEYELTDAIYLASKDRLVKIKKLKGIWLDFGKPEDIKKVEKYLINAKLYY